MLKAKGYYLGFTIVYIEDNAFASLNKENHRDHFMSYGRTNAKEKSAIKAIGSFRNDESFEFVFYEWR